jgi:hypothetical protein
MNNVKIRVKKIRVLRYYFRQLQNNKKKLYFSAP